MRETKKERKGEGNKREWEREVRKEEKEEINS